MNDFVRSHQIISYYKTKYKEKRGIAAVVNRNKVQYWINNILKDMSSNDLKDLIDFYLSTDKNPSLSSFCYEYDEILRKKQSEEKDLESRKKLISRTQQSVEEFRRRYSAGK